MLKIGEFSKLSKTTIRALRYYEKEGLFSPSYIDKETGYRYYESNQLEDISTIHFLRQLDFSIAEIKKIMEGAPILDLLKQKKNELQKELEHTQTKLQMIHYFLKERKMMYKAIIKEEPVRMVYYREGMIEGHNELYSFILGAQKEARRLNPKLKCTLPDYCYIEYLDGEYKEHDIRVRYVQAVEEMGKENEMIHFKEIPSTKVLSVYHKGSYQRLTEAYRFILDYLKENHLEYSDLFREIYIDGRWNKENEEDYLTEIQVPLK